MKSEPLVSVITPTYNCATYIREAIESVINQTYQNWELIIINDGSTDNSEFIIKEYNDPRIRYYAKKKAGVSAARNVGLENMKGEYLCFLDADDILPENSIKNRLQVFNDDDRIEFVDGKVSSFLNISSNAIRIYMPKHKGSPFDKLLEISEDCFFGLSWMIRKETKKKYQFDENLSHSEDLDFYLSICSTGHYAYTDELVYQYRLTEQSAMHNLEGLERGYFAIAEKLKRFSSVDNEQAQRFYRKCKSIMFKSYLSNLHFIKAIRVLVK